MRSGELKERVTIQSMTETVDGESGQLIQAWLGTQTRWGSVEQVGASKEEIAANQLRATALYKFKFRYFAGMTEQQRLLWDGRFFHVHSVENVKEKDLELIVLATEVR